MAEVKELTEGRKEGQKKDKEQRKRRRRREEEWNGADRESEDKRQRERRREEKGKEGRKMMVEVKEITEGRKEGNE